MTSPTSAAPPPQSLTFGAHGLTFECVLLTKEQTPSIPPADSEVIEIPPNSRLLRLSVDETLALDGKDIMEALISKSEGETELSNVIHIKDQPCDIEFAPSEGDEIFFGSTPSQTTHIGRKFLGTIHVVPHESQDVTTKP